MKKLFNFAKAKRESSISRRSITSLESLSNSQNGGYDVESSDKDKSFNKLHRACWLGDVEKARKHANNFDVNSKDRENRTPLHLACAQGHQDVVLVLLGHKANVNVTDGNGLTPLLKAVECEQVNIVKFLLERKVNPNALDKDGNTGLHVAANSGNSEIILLFLQWKVDPNALNKEGQTALHVAVKDRHIDIAQSLLDGGTNVNIQDVQLRSPLIIACQEGFIELVRMLLNYNADVTLKDSLGWTAEDCADMAEHRDCARLVKQTLPTEKEDYDLDQEPHISTHNKSDDDREDEDNSLNVDSWDDNADTDNRDTKTAGILTMALSAGISKFQMSLSDDSVSESSLQHDTIASKPVDTTRPSQSKEEAIVNPSVVHEDEESSWDSEKLEGSAKVAIPEPQKHKEVVEDRGNSDKEKTNVVLGASLGEHRVNANTETTKAATKDVMAELGLSDVSSGDGDESTAESTENDFKIGDFLPNFGSKSQSEPNLLEVGSHLDKEDVAKKDSAVVTSNFTGSVQTLYVDLKKDADISDGSNWDDSEADKEAGTVHIKPILGKPDNELKSHNSLSRTEDSLETSFKRFGSGMDISTDGTLGRDGTMQGVDEIWEENPRLVIDSKIEEQKKQTEVTEKEQPTVTVNEIESGQHLAGLRISNNDVNSTHSKTSIHKDSTNVEVSLPDNQIPQSFPLLQSNLQKAEKSLGGESIPILDGIIENLRLELESERKMRRILEAEVKNHSREKQDLLQKIEASHLEKLNCQKQLAQLEIEMGSIKNDCSCLEAQKHTSNIQLEQIKRQLDEVESKYVSEVKEKQKALNESHNLQMEIEKFKKSLDTEQQTQKLGTRNYSTQTLPAVENDKSNIEIVHRENFEDIAHIERQLSESMANFKQQEEYLCSIMKVLETDSKLLKDHIQELIVQNNTLTSGMNNIAKQSAEKDTLIKIAHEKMLITETEKHKIELEAKQLQAKVSELECEISSVKLNQDNVKYQTSGLSDVLDLAQEKSEAMFKDLQNEIMKIVSALNANNSTVASKLQQLEEKVTKTDALQSLTVKQEIDRIVNVIMVKSKATDTENYALMKDIDIIRKEKAILEQELAEKELQQIKLSQELHVLENQARQPKQNLITNNATTQTLEEIPNIHRESEQQTNTQSIKQSARDTRDFTVQCSLTDSKEYQSKERASQFEACACNCAGVSHQCLKEPLDKLNTFLRNQVERQESLERLHGEKYSSNELHNTLITQSLKESIERLQEQLRLKETHKLALQQQVWDLRILASTALRADPKLPSPERKHSHRAKSRNAPTQQRHRSPLRSSPPSVSWSMPSGPPITSTPLRPKLNTDYLDPNLRLQLERCIDKYLSTGVVPETTQHCVLTPQVMTKDDTSLTCYIAALKSKYDL